MKCITLIIIEKKEQSNDLWSNQYRMKICDRTVVERKAVVQPDSEE